MKSQIIFICLLAIILGSCSGGTKSSIPTEPSPSGISNSPNISTDDTNRNILAIYDSSINPESGTFTITPSERDAAYHLPLTQYYPDVLQITRYGFTPNFWADIKITHPLPLSGIDAFDPRVIAIIPANPGVSMSYPILNVFANNSVVLNPDGYTKLYDSLGGSIPGNTNPFLAYFKDQPNRVWSSTGVTSEAQRWQMNLSGFGGPMQFKLVVDVSTNYPSPPTPVTDNASEPVQIEAQVGYGLTNQGGHASIDVTVLDWQGKPTIGGVLVEAPDLFNGLVELTYQYPGIEPDTYVYSGQIENTLLPDTGTYGIAVVAWDNESNSAILQEFKAEVNIAFNLTDVTPPSFNFDTHKIAFAGNYAYCAANVNGLHIFDATNPENPIWINRVEILCASDVYVSDGCAYVLDFQNTLQIVDVEPPESAHIVKSIDLTRWMSWDLYVSDGYAFVVTDIVGLQIIDIDPIETAEIVKRVTLPDYARGVFAANGYAYVADGESGLQIIDIDPIVSAHIVKTVEISGTSHSVFALDGYAYVLSSSFNIIDVDPVESANIVKKIPVQGYRWGIHVSNEHAFVTCDTGIYIFNVAIPESAYLEREIDSIECYGEVCTRDGYAYVGSCSGIKIIDIDPIDSASIVNTVETPGCAKDVQVSDGLAFIANDHGGLQIVDVTLQESPQVVKTISTNGRALGVFVTNGYAYIADSDSGFNIIDIDPPQSASVIRTIDLSSSAQDVYVEGVYAYVANSGHGLQIIRIDSPETAFIVKSVDIPGSAVGVYTSDGYAYVAASVGLSIVDVDPPESASVVKTIETQDLCLDVCVSGDYAYIANDSGGLMVIDIKPVESAHVVKTVELYGRSMGIQVTDGYAYVASGGLKIIDIDPLESAHLISSIETPDSSQNISVSDNYCFIADYSAGLRIFKLW